MTAWVTPSLFPWRRTTTEDWLEAIASLDQRVRKLVADPSGADYDAIAADARRLANQDIGPKQDLRLQSVAKRMLVHAERFMALRHLRVGITSNRTLSHLIAPLRSAGLARGLLVEAVDIPFDEIRALTFGQPHNFERRRLDAVVIVLDGGAFGADDEALADAGRFLERMVSAVHDHVGSRAVIATIPSTGSNISSLELALSGSASRLVMRINAVIVDGARKHQWLMWDLGALAGRVGSDRWFDPVRFHDAKVPFRLEFAPLAADHLCRTLAAMSGKNCRALVLDLDDTLWGGSIGDDGIAGIRLGQNSAEGEAYLAFQRFVLDLRRRGTLLAVSSKNMDALARDPFRNHPEMLLREEHISIFQANWQDKATNLYAIAEALGLGLESLAFVDDNPAERERVRQQLPLVSVPEIGSDPALFPSRIADSGLFDHLALTAEDAGRAVTYQSRAASLELKHKIGDYGAYLQSLHMSISIAHFAAVDRVRIAQLINKSNQFNLTTRRYSESQVCEFEENSKEFLCWQVRLDDVFGKHGIISVLVVRKLAPTWVIDSWLMSCRVFTRGIEETLMNCLMEDARQAGIEYIIGEYIPTQRNAMVADLYPRLGFDAIEGGATLARHYRANPATHPALQSFIEVKRL